MKKTTSAGTKADWFNPFPGAMAGYYFLMAVVGLLIPDNILKDNFWARELCDLMANFVPQINRITDLGIKSDVNRFYFSVLWASSPALGSLMISQVYRLRERLHQVWSISLERVIFSIFGSMFLLAWTQCLWAVNPTMRLSVALLSTGFGRGFYGQIVLHIGAVFCLANILINIWGLINGAVSRDIGRRHNVK